MNNEAVVSFILENELGDVNTNTSFKNLTTIKCGGKISVLFQPYTINKFILFMDYVLENKLPYFVIGNGSNILASDNEYEGIVISFSKLKERIHFNFYDKYALVSVHAGVLCPVFSKILSDKFLTGGEALSTLPASIGGTIAMNASCYDYKTSKHLVRALIYTKDGLRWYKNYELNYKYRESIVSNSEMIVLAGEFSFEKGKIENIMKKTNFFKEQRKKTQPYGVYSAGSTFRNYENINAWKLIDEVGLRGYSYKSVKVSDVHTNFIVNEGNAKSNDVLKVVQYVKDKVKEEKQILLKEEWIFFNFKHL